LRRGATGKWKAFAVLAVVAVVAVAAAGCGSSSHSSTSATTGTSSSSSSTSGKPVVRVFGFGFLTAPAAGGAIPTQTYMTADPQAAAKAINADPSSKVSVQYTFCDTKFTPTGSQACARQATSPTGCNGKPCTVAFDVVDLSDNLSVPPISATGMPIVGMDVNTPQAQDAPNEFCLTGALISAQRGLGYVMNHLGAHKVGIVGFTTPEAEALNMWTEEGLHAQGLSVSGATIIPLTTPNPAPAINTVMGGNADGIIFIGQNIGVAIKYARSAYKGVKAGLPGYDIQPELLNGLPLPATDGIGVSSWAQPLSATSVPGVAQYWKEAGTAAGPLFKYYDNDILAWLGIHFIANVANTISGSVDKASMLAALKSANNVNMYGIMPPWNASARGTNGAVPCSPYHVFVPETIQGGHQVADEPGVFRDPLNGKVLYVDPGFKTPAS
jgi:hypothetical protein